MGLFGPSRKEIWQELSDQINAQYIDGFWSGTKVVASFKNWQIILDTYTVSNGKTSSTYTRLRAPFINNNRFYFKIYREGLFSDIGKFFGMQDIEVGYPEFDDNFIIKGNDDERVKRLFANSRIRELIQRQPQIHLEIRDNEGIFGPSFGENEDQLYFSVGGVIRDIDRLRDLVDLFKEVLDELNSIGIADEGSPNVKIK